jgi:hypothetical protein
MLIAAAGAALEIPPLLPTVLAGSIVFGAAIPWLVVGLITLTQRLTPPELQGRVYAAAETLITTPQTLSIALGAVLITVTGYETLLLAMASITTLAATYLLTRPEQAAPAAVGPGQLLPFSLPRNAVTMPKTAPAKPKSVPVEVVR